MSQYDERQKWESARDKGLVRFVFINGILKFGGLLFLINFVFYNLLFTKRWIVESLIEDFLTVGVICLVSGLIFGIILWIAGGLKYGR